MLLSQLTPTSWEGTNSVG
jgi:hypothetical protein